MPNEGQKIKVMNKVELFRKGLQSEKVKSLGLKVEKHWTGNMTFTFPQEPNIKFRVDEDAKLKKDGSLDVMWMDLGGLPIKSGVKTFSKEFLDTIILQLNY